MTPIKVQHYRNPDSASGGKSWGYGKHNGDVIVFYGSDKNSRYNVTKNPSYDVASKKVEKMMDGYQDQGSAWFDLDEKVLCEAPEKPSPTSKKSKVKPFSLVVIDEGNTLMIQPAFSAVGKIIGVMPETQRLNAGEVVFSYGDNMLDGTLNFTDELSSVGFDDLKYAAIGFALMKRITNLKLCLTFQDSDKEISDILDANEYLLNNGVSEAFLVNLGLMKAKPKSSDFIKSGGSSRRRRALV